jgi:hypothetical protein
MKFLSKPTNEQIDKLIPQLSSPQHGAYFFAKLENPNWIVPLKERGIFAHPPKAEETQNGKTYFHWPESQYLARMAVHVPNEVALIFAELDTDNPGIIGDILRAVKEMPIEVAMTLIPTLCKNKDALINLINFDEAAEFCFRLAKENKIKEALKLADILFIPRFKEGSEEPRDLEIYWYKRGMGKVIPVLVEKIPAKILPKLCYWLKASVKARRNVNQETGDDLSIIWRPAIENHEQNKEYYFASMMVGFVRREFERAIEKGQLSLDKALEIISKYPYLIFKRLRLYLINIFADQNSELARKSMMDHDGLFEDYRYKHEYAMLLGKRFNLLTPEEKATLLNWIDTGPDMSNLEEKVKAAFNRNVIDEDYRNRKEHWQFEKLHWIRDYLDNERQNFYKYMLAKHGVPQMVDLNCWIGPIRCGSESPMIVSELSSLSFKEAVERVSNWRPDNEQFVGPDKEGLASTFGEYIASNLVVVSKQADILINRPPIYVRTFIEEMIKAIQTKMDIDFAAVFDLCKWVLLQPLGGEMVHEDCVDKNWQWTRSQISEFITKICTAMDEENARYPLKGFKEPIGNILKLLSQDSPVSCLLDREQDEKDPRLYDWLTKAINSPRGKALEAILEYGRWIANHIKEHKGKDEVISGGFEAMPEVREMLEWQIAPRNRSNEAFSIIGSRLGLIYWIDKGWLIKNADYIFDLQALETDSTMTQGWAAWNTFLIWVKPHFAYYQVLKKQFAYAVKHAELVGIANENRIHENPMKHLGGHLMILYGRGQLRLDDDGGVLRQFLSTAKPEIRRHAITFVGRSLNQDEKVPSVIIERFQKLWDVYWSEKGLGDMSEEGIADEEVFGSWFACGQFPEQWSLDQLEQFIKHCPKPEPDNEIIEQLAKITSEDTVVKIVRILETMIKGDREGWRISMWRDTVKSILEKAMQAGGEARNTAERIINYLGRRGYTDLGYLLKIASHP